MSKKTITSQFGGKTGTGHSVAKSYEYNGAVAEDSPERQSSAGPIRTNYSKSHLLQIEPALHAAAAATGLTVQTRNPDGSFLQAYDRQGEVTSTGVAVVISRPADGSDFAAFWAKYEEIKNATRAGPAAPSASPPRARAEAGLN